MAVSNWRNGNINNWNAAADNDWAYTARNSCQGRASGTLAQVTSRETARDPAALGSEDEEADTFAAYTPVLYADEEPSSVGTLSESASNDCTITFTITYQDEQVLLQLQHAPASDHAHELRRSLCLRRPTPHNTVPTFRAAADYICQLQSAQSIICICQLQSAAAGHALAALCRLHRFRRRSRFEEHRTSTTFARAARSHAGGETALHRKTATYSRATSAAASPLAASRQGSPTTTSSA